jgi:alpha-beta hydrolase superfamily lysophospholipase
MTKAQPGICRYSHQRNRILAPACLLIVHGMNEHIGRYGDVARHFSDRFIIGAMDLTAHGLSNPVLLKAHKSIEAGASTFDASRAYLEQAQLRNLQLMRNDLEQALNYLLKQCDKLSGNSLRPVFILSHSLGSLVSASYLLQTKNEDLKSRIKGIIFSGPAFAVTEVPGWRGWFQNPLIAFTFHTHEHFLNPHDEPLPQLLFNQLLALVTVPPSIRHYRAGIIAWASQPVFAGQSSLGEKLPERLRKRENPPTQ